MPLWLAFTASYGVVTMRRREFIAAVASVSAWSVKPGDVLVIRSAKCECGLEVPLALHARADAVIE